MVCEVCRFASNVRALLQHTFPGSTGAWKDYRTQVGERHGHAMSYTRQEQCVKYCGDWRNMGKTNSIVNFRSWLTLPPSDFIDRKTYSLNNLCSTFSQEHGRLQNYET